MLAIDRVQNRIRNTAMPPDESTMLAKWLKEKGYSEADIQKVLARLAQHDQQTFTDSIFDSIANNHQSLDELIGDLLRD